MVKDNVSFESFMEVCNAPLSDSTGLFLLGALERAAEKLSCVLHDEAIWKVVSRDKEQKKLQFTQLAHGRQSAGLLDSHSSRTVSGRVLPLPANEGRGRSFKRFLVSQSTTGGRHSRVAVAFMKFLWSERLGSGGSLFCVHCPLPPLPTCVAGTIQGL